MKKLGVKYVLELKRFEARDEIFLIVFKIILST